MPLAGKNTAEANVELKAEPSMVADSVLALLPLTAMTVPPPGAAGLLSSSHPTVASIANATTTTDRLITIIGTIQQQNSAGRRANFVIG